MKPDQGSRRPTNLGGFRRHRRRWETSCQQRSAYSTGCARRNCFGGLSWPLAFFAQIGAAAWPPSLVGLYDPWQPAKVARLRIGQSGHSPPQPSWCGVTGLLVCLVSEELPPPGHLFYVFQEGALLEDLVGHFFLSDGEVEGDDELFGRLPPPEPRHRNDIAA